MKYAILLACAASLLCGCVTKRIVDAEGLGSFRVELVSIDPFVKSAACADAPESGTPSCPRPFAELDQPVTVRIRATAVSRRGEDFPAYNGAALVDVRPGRLVEVGPTGLLAQFTDGVATVELKMVHGFGATRVWVEDCGSTDQGGTFATGVGPVVYFDPPRIDQINVTTENTTSPLQPRADNACVITGDPRYGVGLDEEGNAAFVGYSHGKSVNAGPPKVGTFLDIKGCSREEYDAAVAAGTSCQWGPLVVTGIGAEGFYVTDLNPVAKARGFNHLYAFNFNYPDDLEVGDLVLSLRGAPMEFASTTQLQSPSWRRDPLRGAGKDLLPAPVHLTPEVYEQAVSSFGSNRGAYLDVEKLEGSLVCMDNLALPSVLRSCDHNVDGDITREGCMRQDDSWPLPKLCSEEQGKTPLLDRCEGCQLHGECDDAWLKQNFCFELERPSDYEICLYNKRTDGTLLPSAYIPAAAGEFCCERACYRDQSCTEESSYILFGQWTAEVRGRYDIPEGDASPVKIALATRLADPDFDPIAEGTLEMQKPDADRRRFRVIGNLRHVTAARPTWVVVARSPKDIAASEVCP